MLQCLVLLLHESPEHAHDVMSDVHQHIMLQPMLPLVLAKQNCNDWAVFSILMSDTLGHTAVQVPVMLHLTLLFEESHLWRRPYMKRCYADSRNR